MYLTIVPVLYVNVIVLFVKITSSKQPSQEIEHVIWPLWLMRGKSVPLQYTDYKIQCPNHTSTTSEVLGLNPAYGKHN